ncbi:MAG TPA: hypothetical protein VK801_06935 [Caulobacteraceae bacterium]|nr:hypothetical protein [Caulobacteraceae bacterium]
MVLLLSFARLFAALSLGIVLVVDVALAAAGGNLAVAAEVIGIVRVLHRRRCARLAAAG